ncbi:MarR family transcriptional regulator [Clostridium sp.]|uniref:MarR family winged helix-turn-helix transcriptional regulator n=1 Tax=Clostridium sp. TaxID=1506 RepID=UPI0028455F1A|nr:MarR family transcriptional regulator [Clostridium sp.]MDR3594214.1 MarR family transcriptional regulator [Clostridium sp.]
MYELEDSLGYLLNIAAGISKNALYSVLSPYEITPEQFILLTKLNIGGDGKTQRQLAAESYKDEANITRILKKLELKGYAHKVSDIKDKRNNLVFITKEGHSLIETLRPLIIDYRKQMFKNLSEEEILTVEIILKKIIENG